MIKDKVDNIVISGDAVEFYENNKEFFEGKDDKYVNRILGYCKQLIIEGMYKDLITPDKLEKLDSKLKEINKDIKTYKYPLGKYASNIYNPYKIPLSVKLAIAEKRFDLYKDTNIAKRPQNDLGSLIDFRSSLKKLAKSNTLKEFKKDGSIDIEDIVKAYLKNTSSLKIEVAELEEDYGLTIPSRHYIDGKMGKFSVIQLNIKHNNELIEALNKLSKGKIKCKRVGAYRNTCS
jgi:hypothetical protein